MPRFRVVLVNPKIDGNVGAVARVMGNFGFKDLWLVDPCEITDEARKRAKHANYILDEAKFVSSLDEALDSVSMVVGTSGIVSPGEKHFIRIPITAREFASKMGSHEGTVALLFGREDLGLFQEELLHCDLLVHIPTTEAYPVLNISHAVAIILDELSLLGGDVPSPPEASEIERDKLFEFFADLLDAIDYPDFRREKTEVMFRRMMGRAVPTKWEFYTIMGVLGDAADLIRKEKENR
jgi:tRNA/rRNA methyltransferase